MEKMKRPYIFRMSRLNYYHMWFIFKLMYRLYVSNQNPNLKIFFNLIKIFYSYLEQQTSDIDKHDVGQMQGWGKGWFKKIFFYFLEPSPAKGYIPLRIYFSKSIKRIFGGIMPPVRYIVGFYFVSILGDCPFSFLILFLLL